MRQMPKARTNDTPTDSKIIYNIFTIPFYEMVHGYSRPASTFWAGPIAIPSGINRLFYQVDRSRSILQRHLYDGNHLHLEKHYLSTWFTVRDSNRQWTTIHLKDIQRFLRKVENQD